MAWLFSLLLDSSAHCTSRSPCDSSVECSQEVKALHEEVEAIYKENQSLNKQQIALNEEVLRDAGHSPANMHMLF